MYMVRLYAHTFMLGASVREDTGVELLPFPFCVNVPEMVMSCEGMVVGVSLHPENEQPNLTGMSNDGISAP